MNAKLKKLLGTAKKTNQPNKVAPMLCTLTKNAIMQNEYVHELKWDGYRIIAHVSNKNVRLDSRSGLDYTSKYPPISNALKALKHEAIIDGEIVVLNEKGLPDFDALQAYSEGDAIRYYCFDLIWLDGHDLRSLTLLERKSILQEILKKNKTIIYSEHFDDPQELFRHVQEQGMEGIVSKKGGSQYRPGLRTTDWYKTPSETRQEFVIGGWIESDNRPFRSLMFGAYNKNKKLEWIGHAGGGFKNNEMSSIKKRLQALETGKSPFYNEVDTDGTAHWIKPQLVGNFKFATFTRSGRIRKPAIFLGFREDKPAKDVVREIAHDPTPLDKRKSNAEEAKAARRVTSEDSNWPKIEKVNKTSSDQFDIGDCQIEIHNVEREIWKGVTKAALIQYYHNVSKYILPYLKDRPLSLHIKPVHAMAPGFYIKDMEGREPECAEVFQVKRKHKKEGKRDIIDYLVCNNEATLLYTIDLGCIDINPANSRKQSYLAPDYIVIDLDPSGEDFNDVIEVALACREFFKQRKLIAFAKTSGKSGIHLFLPCTDFNYTQARTIAENICSEVHQLVKSISTTAVSVSQRAGKVYLDPNQNDEADTVASVYSARPWHVPTVSMPLQWKEIRKGFDPSQFTIDKVADRVRRQGDLFKGVLLKKNAIANQRQLQNLF